MLNLQKTTLYIIYSCFQINTNEINKQINLVEDHDTIGGKNSENHFFNSEQILLMKMLIKSSKPTSHSTYQAKFIDYSLTALFNAICYLGQVPIDGLKYRK